MAVTSISANQNTFTNASNSAGSAKKQQIDFLSMLMVQLKNQDPSQPYDNQQFAAQLATFSQLEELSNIKNLLSNQADVIGMMAMSMENTALPGMIGKYASAASNTLDSDGINSCEIGYKSVLPAVSGQAKIADSSGKIIRIIDLSSSQCRVGEHTIIWDGKDNAGNQLIPGKYKVTVELTEEDGGIDKMDTYTVGKIEAVRFKSSGTVVVINGNEVLLGAINDVRETPY